MPHPLVALLGVLLAAGFLGLAMSGVYRPPTWVPVMLVIAYGLLSRRSARREKAKRLKQLDELRNKRVLNLED